MTLDEWCSLKPGDYIVEVKSGVEREVVEVEWYITDRNFIRVWIGLRKLKPSRYKNPITYYTIHGDQGRWRLKNNE